jgi:RNA polymerase sigma factor (sigma-70 family)
MSDARFGAVLHQIRHLFGNGAASGLTEWQLLRRYNARRDEAAFAALVARHGPMVLGVCRRVLDRPEDVEDAFQATFLVLARKAGGLRERGALGTWLYGVAHRVALRARSQSARRRARERTAVGEVLGLGPDRLGGPGPDSGPDPDLGPVLDEELGRLPAHYREAVVLCYLDGLTHEQAARQLGWPIGTVKGRLARARELLRGRLTRRGLTLSAAALVARLSHEAGASTVPVRWARAAVRGAGRSSSAGAGTGTAAASASAVALAEGVIWGISLHQWTAAAAAMMIVGAVAAGSGSLALRARADDAPASPPKAAAVAPDDAAPKQAEAVSQATTQADGKTEPPRQADPDLDALYAQIVRVRSKLDDITRVTRSPGDPSVVRTRQQLEDLVARYRQLTGNDPPAPAQPATPGPDAAGPSLVGPGPVKPGARAPDVAAEPAPPDPRVIAREGFAITLLDYQVGRLGLESVQAWADRLQQSEAQLAEGRDGEEKALRDHLDRMKKIEAVAKARRDKGGQGANLEWLAARFHRELAERGLARHQAGADGPPEAGADPFASTLKADAIDVVGPGAVAVADGDASEPVAFDAPVVLDTPEQTIRADRISVSGHVRITQKRPRASGGIARGGRTDRLVVRSVAPARDDAGPIVPAPRGQEQEPAPADAAGAQANGKPSPSQPQTQKGSGSRGPGPGSGLADHPGLDARSMAVFRLLDQTAPMPFANETPLEDVIKHVKQVTKSPDFPKGVPIYVDPIGLQEAEKTLTSPITMDLEGVPLKRTLQLALKQLGLFYRVQDGMIYISAEGSEDVGPLPPPVLEPSPFMIMQSRAERGEMSAPERRAFIQLLRDAALIERLQNDGEFKARVSEKAVGLPKVVPPDPAGSRAGRGFQ